MNIIARAASKVLLPFNSVRRIFSCILVTMFLVLPSVNGQEEPLDLSQYKPYPVPTVDPTAKSKQNFVVNQISSYEVQTGKVTEMPLAAGQAAARPANGVAGQPPSANTVPPATNAAPSNGLLNFSSPSAVTNYTTYPYTTRVKLIFTQAGGNYVASGTLVDPYHVMTAGHCVYGRGQYNTTMTVVPSYDTGTEPFGRAYATNFYTFTGWTSSGTANGSTGSGPVTDFDYDVALVRLDRPIGVRTGYLGFGYNTSNSHYTGNTFEVAGYPANAASLSKK